MPYRVDTRFLLVYDSQYTSNVPRIFAVQKRLKRERSRFHARKPEKKKDRQSEQPQAD